MTAGTIQPTIRIAAALIEDGEGRLLLVRKAGSEWFMQPGGRIEDGESPLAALRRELREEIGFTFEDGEARPLGAFAAPAANEPGHPVEAELFHLRAAFAAAPGGEIAEAAWVRVAEASALPLAPLTRDHVLPLFGALENHDGGGASASP